MGRGGRRVRFLPLSIRQTHARVGAAAAAECGLESNSSGTRPGGPATQRRATRRVGVAGAGTPCRGRGIQGWSAEWLTGFPYDVRVAGPGTVGARATVRCVEDALRLVEVGPEGKRTMAAGDWANGARPSGEQLGTES